MKLSSSNIVLYLIPLIATPILSRIYTPNYFGEWGIFASLFTILSVVLFGCYEHVIIKSTDEEFKYACRLSFYVSIAIIVLVALIFLVGDKLEIPFFLEFPSKTFFILYLILSSVLGIFQNISNRIGAYSILALSFIIAGVGQATLRIFFGYIPIFQNGLIAGTVIAQLVCVLFFISRKYWIYIINLVTFSKYTEVIKLAKKYNKFPLYDAPATLLAFAAFNLPTIILSLYYSRADIGCFSIVIQLLLMPMSFIGSAMGRVYYQQISHSENNNEIRNKTISILKITIYLSLLPTLFLILGGDKIVIYFLGAKWHLAGVISLCLTLWSIPTILSQPLISIYRAKNCQNIMLIYNIIYFVGGIGATLIGCNLTSNILYVLVGYSLAGFISKILLFNSILKITDVKINMLPRSGCILFVMTIIGWGLRIWGL